MNILVTGANGFIGKNLVVELKNTKDYNVFEFDKNINHNLLDEYCQGAEFVFHLAGVNRPEKQSEFMEGNFGFTDTLLETLKKHNNNCPVMISSSIQAELENPYGKSKKAGEDLLFNYSCETGAKVFVYRFPNVFGKWCKPNYNSAIATFCNNIANDILIKVNDPGVEMSLVYIDDVVCELVKQLASNSSTMAQQSLNGCFYNVKPVCKITLGEIVDLLYSFRNSREERSIPDMSDAFTKKLYSTYLSYLSEDEFSYELKMNVDNRGSFTEFIKTSERGQVSINVSKPGITKGNHWHHTKNEKFLVVSGSGVIRFRKLNSEKVIEYHVSGDKMEVVDIPVGYTHNIENLGKTDMVTVMWANEQFDPNNPDTYYLEV